MNKADNEIELLRTKVAELETRLEQLSVKHQRDVKALLGCDDIHDKHRKVIEADLEDAFERIKHVELTLYPNLMRDMRHLYRVIGDHEPKAYNRLDFRDRSKKSR
jgi:hypothetical protein